MSKSLRIRDLLAVAATLAFASTVYAANPFTMIDDGTGTKQVAAGGDSLYVLKNNGNIWQLRSGRDWRRLDRGTGTRQIEADRDDLFVLKNNGDIYEYKYGRFDRIEERAYDRRDNNMLSAKDGDLYLMKDNGQVYRRNFWDFDRIDRGTGTRQIQATGDGCFIVKNSGKIWKYNRWSSELSRFSSRLDAKQVVSGDDHVFALEHDGNIWMFERGWDGWRRPVEIDPGTGTRMLALDARSQILYILKNNGNIWGYHIPSDRFEEVDPGTGTKQIFAHDGLLYILKNNGNVWEYRDDLFGTYNNSYRSANFDALHGDGGTGRGNY